MRPQYPCVNRAGRVFAGFLVLFEGMVPRRGLEPPRIAPLVPETSASTSSATWAGGRLARRRNLRTHEGLVNRSLVALLHDFPANAGATLTHPIGDMAGQGGVPLYCFIMFKTGQNVATM